MRLFSFQIKNFKSIIDTGECKLSEIDNIVVMAGQNEAGKTAVLEALDFFRNVPNKNFSKYQKRSQTEITEVLCKFKLEEGDLTINDEVFNGEKIENFYKNIQYISFIRRSVKDKVEEIKLTEESELSIRTLLKKLEIKPDGTETIVSELSAKETGTIEKLPPASAKTEEIANNLINNLIKAIPQFSLYTTFNDLLPSEMTVPELEKSNAIKDFEKVFSVKLAEYAQISDPREKVMKLESLEKLATDDLNKSWSQTISSIKDEKKYGYSIDINNAEPKRITFMIKGKDGIPLYLEQKSMGFKWFSAFHLRLRSLMEDSAHIANKSNMSTRFILLIDEPGQFLHETAQKDVKKILEETAGKNIQIVYSTHNPNLIGTEGKEFTRIRLVSNNEKLGTRVENVAQFISQNKGGSLDALSPIRTAMGLINVQSIFDTNKFSVVVEGITDHYYLSAFRLLQNKDNRIHFIPACGVDNVKHLVSVLIGWGCYFKSVFDDDKDQGRKAYNALKKQFYENDDNFAHENILKIKDCSGIEDIFTEEDFEHFVMNRARTQKEKKKRNSEIAKVSGKEMHARLFLEKIERGEKFTLNKNTIDKIEEVFVWIYTKFNI